MATKKTSTEKANEKITNQILGLLAKGVAPWQKGWKGANGSGPFNLDSGRAYAGRFNSLILSLTAAGDLPAFAPFSKAHPAIKGEKSTYIFQPIIFDKDNKSTGKKEKRFCGFRAIPVFHYTQLQGIDVEALKAKYAPETDGDAPSFDSIAKCEEVIASMPNPPKMNNLGGDQAFYIPSKDQVCMPLPETFECSERYYQVLFHELAHSTGHFTRLNRKEGFEELKVSHEYSFEELVAELTACFVGSDCNIMDDSRLENSAAYLKSWIRKLQDNPDWIIKASSLATKASDYILNKNQKEAEATA